MYAKYIECDVHSESKEAFSNGQLYWRESALNKGFLNQYGGWENNTAIILSLWESKEAIDDFMRIAHDKIAAKAKQDETYSRINVSYLKRVLSIPKNDSEKDANASLIRIADCTLFPEMETSFINVQKTVWNPGMAASQGMLGGFLWQYLTDRNRFLVTTFWSSESCHHNYMENIFPALKAKAEADNSISNLYGHRVQIVKDWTIRP